MDDVGKMDPELERIIKLSTSFYQQGAENLSVANHEGVRHRIPSCINWWITGVDAGSFDIQILNRSINIGIDILNKAQKEDHKMEVFFHQVDDGDTGREILGVSRNVKIAREITGQLLKSPQVNVKIPFLKDMNGDVIISWQDIDNSRNFPIFLDMIRVSASIHRYQRSVIDGSLIATLDDYDNAKRVWESISKEQVTKLNRQDQELITSLVDLNAYEKPVDINKLADKMHKSYQTIYQKLYGRPNDGIKGLVERYDNIRIVEQGETEFEKELSEEGIFEREKKIGSISKQKKLITLRNKVDMLNLNQSVVSIDREKAQKKLDAILSGSFCSSVVEKFTTEKKPNSVA
jgi:predicted transcriptional regulator YheO